MDSKKSSKADLENKRSLFVQIGLIIALTITLVAFEYKTYDRIMTDLGDRDLVDMPEEMVEITRQDQPPPPPAPPPQTTLINIVEDNVDIADDITINVDVDQKTQIEIYVPPVATEQEVEEHEIFIVVEESPYFPGGEPARIKFLQENIKYPQMARESGIQGTVYVQFVVERDGGVTDVKVLRGIGGGCDEEAIRVIKAMPKWVPGKQRNRPVRVQFTMPIRFTLQ